MRGFYRGWRHAERGENKGHGCDPAHRNRFAVSRVTSGGRTVERTVRLSPNLTPAQKEFSRKSPPSNQEWHRMQALRSQPDLCRQLWSRSCWHLHSERSGGPRRPAGVRSEVSRNPSAGRTSLRNGYFPGAVLHPSRRSPGSPCRAVRPRQPHPCGDAVCPHTDTRVFMLI